MPSSTRPRHDPRPVEQRSHMHTVPPPVQAKGMWQDHSGHTSGHDGEVLVC